MPGHAGAWPDIAHAILRLTVADSRNPLDSIHLDGAPAFARVRDRRRAQVNLANITGRVSPGVAAAIPLLLADVPDVDAALNLFERLTSTASSEVLRNLDRHRTLVHYTLVVFGYSRFLGETLINNPDLFHILQREGALDRSHSREEFRETFARFRSRSFETDESALLARFKRREYVRIMLRDVLGIATLAEVTSEISALSDVLIEEALRSVESALLNRYGTPQYRDAEGRLARVPVAVLSLGKLGGNELNYSSDIDLLFLYGDGEDAGAAQLSNHEWFIRLAQSVTEVLSRITPEGPVFRVDLRLRPQGREGEPAVGLSHALDYYHHRAHDWERQALIKVRHSAGDLSLARRFLRGVQSFVYQVQGDMRANFAAIETALEARDRIGAHRRAARRAATDVKLDRGGIRDIEFLVQCLQRVYGGAEPWLRSGGTLFSLQKLHDKGHISGRDFHELTTAYEFLRILEHRLQLRQGQQTHKVPDSPAELAVLSRSVGLGAELSPEQFHGLLHQRMAATAEIYQRIVHGEQVQQQQGADSPEFRLQAGAGGRDHSERTMLHRLAQDAPELFEFARTLTLGSPERRNLFRFLSAAFTSSDRYAAVVQAPLGVKRALELFRTSDFLTDILLRHPEEVATLEALSPHSRSGSGALFDEPERAANGDAVFGYVSAADIPYAEKLGLLRQHYRHRVFRSGVRDVMDGRGVFESLRETTAAAEQAIAAALQAVPAPAEFAVLALGRLGTCEFDVLSDADLLFVRGEQVELLAAARCAEQLMQALSAYTRDGAVFAVDPRLRPRGAEGELVFTPAQLESYLAGEAQPWEALSFSKLRFIAGSESLAREAVDAWRGLRRFALDPGFARALRDMRQRLAESGGEGVNLKTSPGGMYDIDFIAGYLAVRGAAGPAQTNIRERLSWLRDRGLLEASDCALLEDAAEFFRALEHAVRLVTGRARKSLPVGEHARHATEELVARALGRGLAGALESELYSRMEATRTVFRHILE
jgi:glutamate-ammonia-ligase adenylyltransferase